MTLNRTNIEFVLRAELEQARIEFDAAKINFRVVTADIPSGLPQPDGTGRITGAGQSFRAAMEAYAVALHEFNDFIVNGTVPERLQNKVERTNDSARQA